MLQENLKNLRKREGYSQEELAIRLNVVRQTISKWEKGLSVPDADMLLKIAEVYDVSVDEILGVTIDTTKEEEINAIAEQLVRINEQLAIKNNRWRKFWKILGITILVLCILWFLITVLRVVLFNEVKHTEIEETSVECMENNYL